MSSSTDQDELFPDEALGSRPDTVVINGRCAVRTKGGHRVVSVAGLPTAHFSVGDRMAEAYAMVTLVEQGWAEQAEVARAFGCSTRTVRRCQRRFEEGGMAALGRGPGFPKGRRRLPASRLRRVQGLKAAGLSGRAIAERLGVSEKAVRKLLVRAGWKAPGAVQCELPLADADLNVSASAAGSTGSATATARKRPSQPAAGPFDLPGTCAGGADPNPSAATDEEAAPFSFDSDPALRRMDRFFACLGLIDDAAPIFRTASRVPRAGVLLALPALVGSGIFACAREVYGTIGPAFYGLRTSFVAMLLMALLRIKRPEALKEHVPDDLGRLLGLDRAPEVKTLRRKLRCLASFGRATEFGRALARKRVASHGAALGFLYIDGHVRVYHGKRTLPKAHVARMRLALPATTDYWVGDLRGDPLFVVTAEANAGLVKMLPPLLTELRGLLGPRRLTIVFDRGGWSPRLFQKILAEGFDVLTYRKGRSARVRRSLFRSRQAVIDGTQVRYTLADSRIRLLGGRLRLRQVTRLSEDGHQTPIVTSRLDLTDVEVAFRMFERWRQENFFKYLREEYALDALVDYDVEPADATREVPNPRWNALDAQLRAARAELAVLGSRYGLEAFRNVEAERRTMRGFKIAHAPQNRQLRTALERCLDLERRRASVPRRVPVQQVVDGPVIQLDVERKHLTNLIKMVAYQAESDLVRMLTPHYSRAADEGRTLLQSALASAADIEVTNAELRVTLTPLSSPHRSRAIAAICDELNASATCFPGTNLRLRFAVALPPAEAS